MFETAPRSCPAKSSCGSERTNGFARGPRRQFARVYRNSGGTVLNEGVVAGIHYHGLAVQLPIRAVQQVLDTQTRDHVQLVQSEQIQFFRAAGQIAARALGDGSPSTTAFMGPQPIGTPRIALLDGLPLQNHRALLNRLVVDDPDSFETDYRADARSHGTAMASLIVWGISTR